jgi:hypothetical protein
MAQDHDHWDAGDFDNLFLVAILLYAVLTAAFAWDLITTYVLPGSAHPAYEPPGYRA